MSVEAACAHSDVSSLSMRPHAPGWKLNPTRLHLPARIGLMPRSPSLYFSILSSNVVLGWPPTVIIGLRSALPTPPLVARILTNHVALPPIQLAVIPPPSCERARESNYYFLSCPSDHSSLSLLTPRLLSTPIPTTWPQSESPTLVESSCVTGPASLSSYRSAGLRQSHRAPELSLHSSNLIFNPIK